MEIETKNASLDTLAVTILALHVSGKQMTIAVFRQLPEGVEQQGAELWGTVRYAIKDSGDLWLVFSNDGRLFRRNINLQLPWADKRLCDAAEKEMKRIEEHAVYCEANYKEMKRTELGAKYWEDVFKRMIAARLDFAEKYAAWKEKYDSDVSRYEYEKKLSDLRQLFISV